MATLASAADVRTECNLPGVTDDTLLTPHLESAEQELKDTLGSTQFAAVATPSSPYQAADMALLKKAEALLAGAYALAVLNTATSGAGIITAQVAGGGGAETRYLSQAQADAKAADLRRRAVALFTRYRPGETDEDREANVTGGVDLGGVRLSWL